MVCHILVLLQSLPTPPSPSTPPSPLPCATHLQVDRLMAQRMATWVLWGVITWQRRFLEYRDAQARWAAGGAACQHGSWQPHLLACNTHPNQTGF